MAIVSVRIFPAIGIARLGNSPDGFFIGPEVPGDHTPPAGGYKDASCQMKRQAARFRIYGFDAAGNLVQEITNSDAAIEWTVELANTKGSWRRFDGADAGQPGRNGLTGAAIGNSPPHQINPGPRTLNGPNQAAAFNTGQFLGKFVPLGEMRTEADGRLLVLGGFGRSAGVPASVPLQNIFNNNNWHDDVSDGPVTARVTLNGTATPLLADPAWVICAPPNFAPPVTPITTLYDVLFQVARDKGWVNIPALPSFTLDIWPLLQRTLDYRWVNSTFKGVFTQHKNRFTTSPAGTFNRVRDPAVAPTGAPRNMPSVLGDNYPAATPASVLTRSQYQILQKWSGTAGTDWNDDAATPPPLPTAVTPDGLTRAALESCVGGAFWPGIEAGWYLRDPTLYKAAFRFDPAKIKAGDVTRQMALPWQTDFFMCKQEGDQLWWPARRPDEVLPEAAASAASDGATDPWTGTLVPTQKDMVELWHKLGIVVKKTIGGNEVFVETERRVVCTSLFLVTDRSHYGEDEVKGALLGGVPGVFLDALYVVAQGFLPAELGVTTATPTPSQLAGFAPVITVPVAGMTARPQQLLLQDASLPASLRQRFTFVYQVEFTDTSAFVTEQTVAITATKGSHSAAGKLFLIKQPNPYMLDGPVSWLSTDVRVFKLLEGAQPYGAAVPPVPALGNDGAAARSFIGATLNHFRTFTGAGHPFDALVTGADASRLQLSQKEGTKRVFNFAVARVRYRGNLSTALGVRVFFRLFTTAATGLDYDQNASYRRSTGMAPIALLGEQANKLVTIPFFAAARVPTDAAVTTQTLAAQQDPLNVADLLPSPGNEVQGYFGCWLDINQPTEPWFPNDVAAAPDGPWAAGRLPIQSLIRGLHQCLVAEVHFPGDPIEYGATPAGNDNLAQRNLVIVESGNPGSLATRTVQHTFEIKATNPLPEVVLPQGDMHHGGGEVRMLAAGPDELMIRWQSLPRTSRLTLYMPGVDADDVLRLAAQNLELPRLQRVDAHTLLCLPGDVSYVPLPPGRERNTAALLSVELPEGVKADQQFSLVVQQISGQPRKVLGAFQLNIPVRHEAELLVAETRNLSVLRHVALSIPPEDPWRPIFQRYLAHVADRVRGFGGDPDEVAPAGDGSGRDEAAERCQRQGHWVVAALALLVLLAGWPLPGTPLPQLLVVLALVWAGWSWRKLCAPSRCHWAAAALFGLGAGAAALSLLLLAGLASPAAPWVLAIALLLLVAVALWGLRPGCLRAADAASP